MRSGQIEAVRIASILRGCGFGSVMIDWAVARCRGVAPEGASWFNSGRRRRAPMRTDAHRFYERFGFVKSHVGMKLHLND